MGGASSRRAEDQGSEQHLIAALERAFGGDPGARVFLQAALHAARLVAPPEDSGALLEFARAHLLPQIVGELGVERARAFVDALAASVADLSPRTALDSGVQATPTMLEASDLVAESRRRAPVSGPRPRVLLVYGAQFARMRLARHVLQAHCNVVVVSTFADLAVVSAPFPTVALVHLGHDNVGILLEGMVARFSEVRVVAILAHASVRDAEQLLTRSGVRHFEIAPSDASPSDVVRAAQRIGLY